MSSAIALEIRRTTAFGTGGFAPQLSKLQVSVFSWGKTAFFLFRRRARSVSFGHSRLPESGVADNGPREETLSAPDASQVGRVLKVSSSRVSQLRTIEAMPAVMVGGKPRFSPEICVPWYYERFKSRSSEPNGDTTVGDDAQRNGPALDAARLRKLEADAKMAELRYAIEVGQLIRTEDAMGIMAKSISGARAKLLSVAPKLAPLLALEDSASGCQALVEAEIHAALEELARCIEFAAPDNAVQ